ncbi:ASPIC/UnbV domain-containing protein [Acidobacteria bacterium AH-259-O06]|nr:ASPIC/UnbV domain-containing protein [Acidobacteria bacterium AH-259-O06]
MFTSSGRLLHNHVTTAVSYASSSDPRVHFGLGKEEGIARIEILWPGGRTQVLENVEAARILRIREE